MPFATTSRQPVNFGRRQPANTIGELRERIALLRKRAAICMKTPRGKQHASELEAIARQYSLKIDEIQRREQQQREFAEQRNAEAHWVHGGAHVR